MEQKPKTDKVHRISVSLPEKLTRELDQMVTEGGYLNRSQAIAHMIRNTLLEHYQRQGTQVMAGAMTLVYDEARPNLRANLVRIQRKYIDSVISSLNVLLENDFSLEVLQVQGPVNRLNKIVKEIRACKGVESCKLALTSTVIPPIHRKEGVTDGDV
ncbi:MAG: ribbon-helix-helix protein, CopG family [Proteobacteria bacterium]|nr:ribbon-helix-helix protein, CopG family [Pseudomonadota bacterium]MBU1057367.1 ribbon-helix-helix protein, CopG family [Pseudomonadota bacterium]